MKNNFDRRIRMAARPIMVFKTLDEVYEYIRKKINESFIDKFSNITMFGYIDENNCLSYPEYSDNDKTYEDIYYWLARNWPNNENGYFMYVFNSKDIWD